MGDALQQDDSGSAMPPSKLINFVRGWPAPSLLPASILLKAANQALTDPELFIPALQYAPDPGPLPLRLALASFLGKFYRSQISIDRISITGGASQSLGIALGALTDPGYTRRVWVLQPTYFLAFRIIDDAGLKVEGVEDAKEGIDFAEWETRLAAVEKQAQQDGQTEPRYKPMPREWPTKIYKNVFYCVPSFSNPTGRCMSLQNRIQMVRLARKFDALIITDDVYDFLWWDANSADKTKGALNSVVPRIVDVDRILDGGAERTNADGFGNALSNGSFSKICGPGVRTGWVEGTPSLAYALSQAGPIRSGGASSNLAGVILALTLESGDLEKHITEALIPSYSQRWRVIIEAVDKHLVPLGVTIPWRNAPVREINNPHDEIHNQETNHLSSLPEHVAGGYFLWLRLPSGIDATELASRAQDEENMIIQTEAQCRAPNRELEQNKSRQEMDAGDIEHSTSQSNSSVRLCFAWEDEHVLVEGVERLASVLARFGTGPRKMLKGTATTAGIDQNQYS